MLTFVPSNTELGRTWINSNFPVTRGGGKEINAKMGFIFPMIFSFHTTHTHAHAHTHTHAHTHNSVLDELQEMREKVVAFERQNTFLNSEIMLASQRERMQAEVHRKNQEKMFVVIFLLVCFACLFAHLFHLFVYCCYSCCRRLIFFSFN